VPLTPEERTRLRLTLDGMVTSAWQKYPKASAGELVDVWRQAVEEADKRRRARSRQHRRRTARTAETARAELARAEASAKEE